MKIAVGAVCLAAVVVLNGVIGLTVDQQLYDNGIGHGYNDTHLAQLTLERRRGKGLCRRKLRGRCVKRRKRCPGRFNSQTSPGRPYCGKFHRCCYLEAPEPPTTTAPSTTTATSTTTRPFDWQPEYCENLLENSAPIPTIEEEENQAEFIPGPSFTAEEIEAALLNTTLPDIPMVLPCRSVFLQNESSNRGIISTNWPLAAIPYEIDDTFDSEQRQRIINGIEEIKAKTCLTFPPKSIDHTNWMRIRLGAADSGCYASSLGLTGSTPPIIINLEYPGCFSQGTIVHEILHVAGLAHEHTRLDRDNYVTINWDNIKPGDSYTYQFCKAKNIDTGHIYDYDSVMHYGAYGFSIDWGNLETIDAKGNTIGQRDGMSEGDVEQLNYIYCDQTRECATGWQTIGSSSKQYCFVEEPTSWYAAHAYCKWFGTGAQLAILDTETLRTDMKDYMSDNSVSRAWVGARSEDGTFSWNNGNPVTDDSWDESVPTPEDDICVYAYSFTTPPLTLKTLTCTIYYTTMQFICEK